MEGKLAFTRYVEASARAGRPAEGPELEALWVQLRGVLAKELQQRGLWLHSPKLLGIHGTASWAEEGGEALEELASDCFSVAVLHRLPTYEAHLKAKPNVEGLVFRAITNFLYDTQKRHDPLGFRVYLFVHAGVRHAVDAGVLALRSGPATITNESVLVFASSAIASSSASSSVTGLAESALREWSRRSAPVFAAGILKAGEQGRRDLARRFVEHLGGLGAELRPKTSGEVCGFSFKSMADCWKLECRSLWASMLEESNIGPRPENPLPAPGSDFEAREAYRALRRCVLDGIDGGGENKKARGRLHQLFEAFDGLEGESILSDRGLEKLLGIPRRQVAKLRARLKELASFCSRNWLSRMGR